MKTAKSSIRFYPLPELPDVELVHGLNVCHRFPRHIHASFSLGIIERGTRVFETRGKRLTVAAGECFLLQPHEPHCCDVAETEEHDYWTLSVTAECMRRLFVSFQGKATASPSFSRHIIRECSLALAMRRFFTAVENDEESFGRETSFCELMRVLFTLDVKEREESSEQVDSYAVAKVRKYLEQHFDEKIQVEELAEFARISPFYLTRLFERELGVPPYEYLVKIRLAYAQRFLREGESIAGAAYRAGFSDQSHLNRFFKRYMGLTPGEFVRTQFKTETKK